MPHMHTPAQRPLRPAVALLLAASVAAVGACSSQGEAGGDSAAATTADAPAAPAAGGQADTGMAGMTGMDHSKMDMAGMNRSAPRDSNQAFLRMMSDHHAGLLMLADSAAARATSADAKAKAREMDDKQHREQRQMLSMLSRQYGDSVTPMIMPSNGAMMDALSGAQGAEYDRTFYRQVIAHHREAVVMVDKQLPALTGEVKQMAQRMRAEQQREIRELEGKIAQAGGRS